jgi:hypothetical protein
MLAIIIASCHFGPCLSQLPVAVAKDVEPAVSPEPKMLRYDEDYSYLRDASQIFTCFLPAHREPLLPNPSMKKAS